MERGGKGVWRGRMEGGGQRGREGREGGRSPSAREKCED